ncbi:MAG: DUF2608 domain-containing protein [Anaerolineae bacterium]
MIKKILQAFLMVASFSFTPLCFAEILETTRIEDIRGAIDSDTVVFFDMDDTISDSTLSVGSGTWRHYLKDKIKMWQKKADIIPSFNLHNFLVLLAAKKIAIKPVEEATVELISDLQKKGVGIFCLTARGSSKWYSTTIEGIDELTKRQLQSIGVDFSKTAIPAQWRSLDRAIFLDGIFLAANEEKGLFLEKIFNRLGTWPRSVIFIDDKRDQIESVEEALAKRDISFKGFWYRLAEANHSDFDPLAAAFQLEAFLFEDRLLSDEQAFALSQAHPDLDPDQYFFSVLNRLAKALENAQALNSIENALRVFHAEQGSF